MKKFTFTMLLTLAAIMNAIPAMAEILTGSCGENATYTLDTESGLLKIEGSGAMNDYSSSSSPWYSQRRDIISVEISEGITSIGNFACYYCSSLTSINIPESVTSIKRYAFGYCSSLSTVTIPASVTSIEDYAFQDCYNVENLIYADGCSTILRTGLTSITSVTIPESVTAIGRFAFAGCRGLTSVTIPASVTSIDGNAFQNCDNVKNLIYADGCSTVLGTGLTSITSVTIPESVTSIGSCAFSDCRSLTSVTIPESVTCIGSEAFSGCTGLTSVNISNIASWCNVIFNTALYSNSTPLPIDYKLYLDGELITDLVIPNTVSIISKHAFSNCSSLTSVSIPASVTSIESSAFSGCRSLTSVTIPESVTSIGSEAFYGCGSLTSVVIPASVTTIEDRTFEECRGLTSVTIPETVTSIGSEAFYGCGSLSSVAIPASVTTIEDRTFYNCSSLTSLTIPETVTCIGSSAFSGCSGLTSVTIPASVTSIRWEAFYNCYQLRSITCLAVVPPICESNVFLVSTGRDNYDRYKYAQFHVPMGSGEEYASAFEWCYFEKIKEDMEADGKVYYANLVVKQGTTGFTRQAMKADETYTIFIGALGENKVNAVTFNGKDVTDQVFEGYYTTPQIKKESVLSISYEYANEDAIRSVRAQDNIRVLGGDGEITICGLEEPAEMRVYSEDGKMVGSDRILQSGSIRVPEDHVYIVKIGERTFKVAI